MKTKIAEICFGFIPPEERKKQDEACRALEGACPGFDDCLFYKNAKRHEADRLEAYKRLSMLPEKKQAHIALMYYRGKMPWRKNDGKS